MVVIDVTKPALVGNDKYLAAEEPPYLEFAAAVAKPPYLTAADRPPYLTAATLDEAAATTATLLQNSRLVDPTSAAYFNQKHSYQHHHHHLQRFRHCPYGGSGSAASEVFRPPYVETLLPGTAATLPLMHSPLQPPSQNFFAAKSSLPSSASILSPARAQTQIPIEEDACMDHPRPPFCMSPSIPGFQDSGAIFALSPFGMGMCGPAFVLERLGPHILRSHVSTVQYKPIPNDYNVNLESFRFKDPGEWGLDDVIGWMIAVAKKHSIPIDDMNMHRFADCNGPLLNLMNQQNFTERDPTYGPLLYVEFRRLHGDDVEPSVLDKIMLAAASSDIPGPSGLCSSRHSITEALAEAAAANKRACSSSSSSRILIGCGAEETTNHESASHHTSVIKLNPSAATSAGSSKQKSGESVKRKSLKSKQTEKITDIKLEIPDGIDQFVAARGGISTKEPKKRKDGKPRRRSQHTKGNKLWEFIRDALRDPETCPTVVRWEDSEQGVFRIVESEKLAKLWGEKKNNQKMTYEKLSRAMRTYYEKKILVPVPKTGLYPKKLVYKFGPSALGWNGGGSSIGASASTVARGDAGGPNPDESQRVQASAASPGLLLAASKQISGSCSSEKVSLMASPGSKKRKNNSSNNEQVNNDNLDKDRDPFAHFSRPDNRLSLQQMQQRGGGISAAACSSLIGGCSPPASHSEASSSSSLGRSKLRSGAYSEKFFNEIILQNSLGASSSNSSNISCVVKPIAMHPPVAAAGGISPPFQVLSTTMQHKYWDSPDHNSDSTAGGAAAVSDLNHVDEADDDIEEEALDDIDEDDIDEEATVDGEEEELSVDDP